jgi:hypothetical protein
MVRIYLSHTEYDFANCSLPNLARLEPGHPTMIIWRLK